MTLHGTHGRVRLLMCPSFPAPRSCLISTAHQAAQRSPSAALARGHQYPCWLPFITQHPKGPGRGWHPPLHCRLSHCNTARPYRSPRVSLKADTSVFYFVSCLQTAIKTLIKTLFHRNLHQLHSHRAKPLHPHTLNQDKRHSPKCTQHHQSTFHHLPGNGDVPDSSRVTGLLS